MKFRRIENLTLENKTEILIRLNSKTKRVNNCWIYTGATVHGRHGKIRIGKKIYLVHRLSAHFFLGYDLADIKQINHKRECGSGLCWNSEHLYIGTNSDNMLDYYSIKNRTRYPGLY